MQPLFPPVGAEISCSAYALNVPLQTRSKLVSVDFRGSWRHRVEDNPDDPMDSRRLVLVGFRMTAELPADAGEGLGRVITIEQSDDDGHAVGVLKVTQKSPTPRYDCFVVLGALTMVLDQRDGGPLALAAKNESTLVAQVTAFPPMGETFQLQNPVEFVDRDRPDTAIAIIQRLTAKAAGA